ncbi:dTMP kinase [Azospira sp. APE16]|uniref:Thymidylate kinase n=1 Tax=Azospira oryzae (strain ATCC BAA-33 / DSM 13638 / PS) TaxID=640081 RepID=G8QPA4_AZOOP|nr:dTMP kinase [Azospira oryzae]AEV27005.1 thymidylate kinase [Azospira oryzae PS]MBP7488911.1 dTMP kinase [Azospira sp.]
MRGKFITFEGIDGAGKSTHIQWLADQLTARGKTVVTTREPGGTPLGEKLRALLLAEPMHLETEALLMFAARREHLAEVIEPALAAGTWVISDRFTDATVAYQGGGRGLSLDKLKVLEDWVHGHLQPDLTLLFDLPLAVAQARIGKERILDRFEQEEADFHERVRQCYLQRAGQSNGRIRVVQADRTVDEIKKSIEELISTICL